MNFEFNKIFGALLLAGIVAMTAGFVARALVHPEQLAEAAYPIEVAEADVAQAGGDAAAEEELPPIAPLLATASVERGQQVTKACAACHSFEQGGAHKVGPNLWGVVGASKAQHDGAFAYSDALLSAEGEWTFEEMNAFLAAPKKAVPGTKMNYAGLKKPEDRADLIAYLNSLSASPLPLQ